MITNHVKAPIGMAVLLMVTLLGACDSQSPLTEADSDVYSHMPATIDVDGDDFTITYTDPNTPKLTSATFNSLANKLANDYTAKSYLQLLANWMYNYQAGLSTYKGNKQVDALAYFKSKYNPLKTSTTFSQDEIESLGETLGISALTDIVENPNHQIRKKAETLLARYPDLKKLPAPALATVFHKAIDKINIPQGVPYYPDEDNPDGGLFGPGRSGSPLPMSGQTCDNGVLMNFNDCVSLNHKRFMSNLALSFGGEIIATLICVAATSPTGIGPAACIFGFGVAATFSFAAAIVNYSLDVEECAQSNDHGCDCKNTKIKTYMKGVGCEVDSYGDHADTHIGDLDRIVPPPTMALPDENGTAAEYILVYGFDAEGVVTLSPLTADYNCHLYYSKSECSLMFP